MNQGALVEGQGYIHTYVYIQQAQPTHGASKEAVIEECHEEAYKERLLIIGTSELSSGAIPGHRKF
jgi:hypothetical protein